MVEQTVLTPTTLAEVQAAVRETPRLLARGGGTKPALSTPSGDVTALDLSALAGVLDYDPGEFTFTALAGTRVAAVQAMLGERGQYLPFDPPLADPGATLGGTVAAGLSGPGRYRYGGVRDFILGVRLVDGNGDVIRGGGKVVKNSAGFDIPKLMVGSLGQLGVLVELTFKVFPQAPAHVTIVHDLSPLTEALAALTRLYTARLEIEALEMEPGAEGLKFWVRLAGLPEALPARAERVRQLLGGGEVLADPAVEPVCWRRFRNLESDLADRSLIKIPLTPRRIPEVQAAWRSLPPQHCHYSGGGNLLWLSSPEPPGVWHERLKALNLSGLVVMGPPGWARIGAQSGQAFEQRVKSVFDPHNRFQQPRPGP
jgi:glycolate oxidase FAD binding subunit